MRDPPHKPPRAAPLPVGLRISNRDWIIPVECSADSVLVVLTGQRIPTAALERSAPESNPLLRAVEQLIARRQATVRPGEPPYRPMIRFRVWPEGFRAYYLAYPVLESLHVPMARENVEPEESKRTSEGR
jgi:hypothetical protein